MASSPTARSRPNYNTPAKKTKAKALMQACIDDARQNTARLERDKADWHNLLLYRGGVDNHWTVWDRGANAWVPRPYSGDDAALPEWVPRACTNIFAVKIDGITALLDQSEPAQEWRPTTDDDEDVAAASVIDTAMPALFTEVDYDTLRRQIHKYITLVDKVALHLYYDNHEKYGTRVIPALQCPTCSKLSMQLDVDDAEGACPECGQSDQAMTMPPLAADGTPQGRAYPIGRLCARLHASFEFSVPRSARVSDERALPWILLHGRYAKEDALATWPQAKAAIEHAGQDVRTGMPRQYADAMTKLAAPTPARGLGSGTPTGPVVYQLQHDPTDEFPEGLYAVMIGDEIVDCTPLPVQDDDGCPQKSILIRTFALAPGSPFNKPPADDLGPLQYWRNLIESLIALSLLHNAAPTRFIPTSVILEDQPTGRPGQDVRYRSQIPGERPFIEPGHNPAEGLYKYLEILDQKFEEVSKLNAVLMGTRPHGDPTLGETQILQERGMAAFKTPLDTLVEFENRVSRMLLLIARTSAWSPRFRSLKGENGQWEVDQFAFTDLKGKVDVFCEPASAWPRSPLMTNLKIKEAVGMGALMPQMDPELAGKMLVLLDLSELKPSQDVVRKQIARQLDRWKAAASPQDIMNPQDPAASPQPWWGVGALQMHLMHKSQFLMSEEVEQLAQQNPPVYQAMVMHVTQLQQLVMMMTAPPPEPEQKDEGDKKPDGSALDDAVKSGALTPGGPPAPADPMQAAVSSGALVPMDMAQGAMPSIDDLLAARILMPVTGNGDGAGGAPPS